jgi:predicted lactoylglutathione lyase
MKREPHLDSFGSMSGIPVVHGREDVNCLSADSRQAVDTLVDLAVAAGWSEPWPPTRRGRQMYGRADADLDGHLWEILWMDPQAAEI